MLVLGQVAEHVAKFVVAASSRSASRRRIMTKVEALQDDLAGDVKQLTNFTPEHRLRVGDYRVLFEADRAKVIVYRVIHRKDAYK